jgi:hypothetical protein
VAQDFFDGVGVAAWIEGGDYFHFAAALGAEQRVRVVETLDECGPVRFLADRHGRRQDRDGAAGCDGRLFLIADAAALVGVPAVVADQVFTGLGDVLGEFSDEDEGFEVLEVALDPMVSVPRFTKMAAVSLSGTSLPTCPLARSTRFTGTPRTNARYS